MTALFGESQAQWLADSNPVDRTTAVCRCHADTRGTCANARRDTHARCADPDGGWAGDTYHWRGPHNASDWDPDTIAICSRIGRGGRQHPGRE